MGRRVFISTEAGMTITRSGSVVLGLAAVVIASHLVIVQAQAPTLTGSYSATVTAGDLTPPPGMPVERMAGTWTVTFTADGRYGVKQDGTERVSGTYVSKDDQVTLTDSTGEFACTEGADPSGVYRVAIAAGAVTFTKVKDASCPGRAAVLTAKPFQAAR
jgi:hypothetical protein